MPPSSAVLMTAIVSLFGPVLVGQGSPPLARRAARHGFHADGSPWLWPAGAQVITEAEVRGDLARSLQGQVALAWTLDRGVAELIAAAAESRLSPLRRSSQIRVRLFYENGRTEDLETRVVISRVPGPEARATDEMLVETIVPTGSPVTRMQLIDHQEVVAWEGMVQPHLLEAHPVRIVPKIGIDYLPLPMEASSPGQPWTAGFSSPHCQAGPHQIQQLHVQQGLYPPAEPVR